MTKPTGSRWRPAAIIGLLMLAAGAACSSGTAATEPGMVIGDSVADDFAALATTTFDDFAATATGLEECLGNPRLEAAPDLDDLASYDPSSATIYVRVPATAASLGDSLTHELAHHLEVACPSHQGLRPEFLATQHLPAAAAWFGGEPWEQIPSEQFAETVVQVVRGRRLRNVGRIVVEPASAALVAEWMATGGT